MFRICVILIALLPFIVSPSWSDNFNQGMIAYKKRDFETAFFYWQPLAEEGNPYTQYNLGILYGAGRGVSKNEVQAEKWFKLSAEQGHLGAQYNLGKLYQNGRRIVDYRTGCIDSNGSNIMCNYPVNHAAALKWFTLAAKQGHDNSQVSLGDIYHRGMGTLKDTKAAMIWWRRAAEQGNTLGQMKLGAMFTGWDGTGVEELGITDPVYSYMWFSLAAFNSKREQYTQQIIQGMNELEKKMSLSQKDQALALARECIAKNYKGC